jgi:hypothetical protein
MKSRVLNLFIRFLHEAGPYIAIELLMPGGSLIAILSWLYRRYRRPALFAGAQNLRPPRTPM